MEVSHRYGRHTKRGSSSPTLREGVDAYKERLRYGRASAPMDCLKEFQKRNTRKEDSQVRHGRAETAHQNQLGPGVNKLDCLGSLVLLRGSATLRLCGSVALWLKCGFHYRSIISSIEPLPGSGSGSGFSFEALPPPNSPIRSSMLP